MTDLARLGIAVESSGVDTAARALGGLTSAARSAEAATESLAGSSRNATGATRDVSTAATAQAAAVSRATASAQMHAVAMRTMEQSSRMAAMQQRNLIFQLNDVGVSLASGMNPLMVAIQQGSQIATIYEGGVVPALKETARMAGQAAVRFAPLLAVIGLATAAIGGMTHEINKTSGVTVTFGDTALATWQVISGGIYQFIKPAVDAIAGWFGAAWAWVVEATKNTGNAIIRFVVGAIEYVKTSVATLPAAFIMAGQAAGQGLADAITEGINAVVDRMNGLISGINQMAGQEVFAAFERMEAPIIDIGGVQAAQDHAAAWADYANTVEALADRDIMGEFFGAIQQQAIQNANARLAENEDATGKAAKAAKEHTKALTEEQKAAQKLADSIEQSLGGALASLFDGPITSLSDALDGILGSLASLGQQNLQNVFQGLFVGPAANDNGIAKAVERGAAAGTEAGASGGIFDGLSNLFGGGQNGPAIASGLSAGLGGLGIGYQTQSPIMGALGGAMSGAAGGPIGMVLGGIGGFIGGLFGMNQALEEAKDKLNTARGAIDSLLDVGEGRGVGQMAQAFRDFWDKSHEYQALAAKAQDGALQKRLQDAVNTFFLQLDKDFRLGFEGTLDALSSGQGMGGAFVSAQQQIVSLREELKAFVADTEFMGNKLAELAGIDNGSQVAADLARARRAAQDFALSVLSGSLEMTEMEKAVAEAEGKASALQVTLEQLGMSAGEAAAAIDEHLGLAVAKLRDQYTRDLTSSINDLSGMGWLNEIVEAQAKYQERLRDGAALGIDGSLALTELNLSLTNIARSAGLSQAQIDLLAQSFPAMTGIVEQLASQDLARNLADARADLQEAYEAERSAIEGVLSGLERFITSTRKFRDELRLDQSLSPLSPQQRFLEAQNQFQTVMAQALGGDENAMGRVEDVSRQYLEEARAYYGTSEGYFQIFEEVERLLDGVLGAAQGQLTDAQQQLAVLNQQAASLLGIETGVLTMAQAINNLAMAQAASDAALLAQINALSQGSGGAINQAYQTYLGRSAEAGGMAFWQQQLAAGQSMDWVLNAIRTSQEAAARGMGSFSTGGFTGSGSPLDVAGIVHREEFVFDAASTRRIGVPNLEAMRAGQSSNDNSSADLLREFQAMRNELSALREEMGRNTAVTAAGASAQVAATGQTAAELKAQSAALRIASAKRGG